MKISLSKLFFLLAILGSFLFLLRPIGDPDFWWHIKTGQLILVNQQIPHFDIFSFTAYGKPWIAHEWLSEVIMFLTYKWGGIPFTQTIFAILIILAFGFSLARSQNRTNFYALGSAFVVGVIASTPVLWARPQVFSILYSSIFVFLLNLFLKNGKKKYLLPLPFLMILWVNQHGAFIVGLGLIGIFILGLIIDNIAHVHDSKENVRYIFTKSIWYLIAALFVCTCVTLINPNGIKILIYPFQTINDPSLQTFSQEWASPNFHERTWIPLTVMLLGILGFGLKAKKNISTIDILLCLTFGFMVLYSARHVALFAIVTIPILSDLISDVIPFETKNQKTSLPVAIISILSITCAFFFGIYQIIHLNQKQSDYMRQFYPVKAAQFIKQEGITGKIFNSFNWGGYLIWNMYPETKVYIDGRCDMYGADFVNRFVDIYFTKPGWQKALTSDDIDYVLIEPNTYLSYAIRESQDWKVVFSDDVSILFQREAH